jgi:hypothetical protein
MVAALITIPLAGVVAGVAPTTAGASTSVPSSQGTDFWVAFENNYGGGSSLFLFISGNTATTGTVTDPAIAFSQTFSVTPGVATTVQLPSNAEVNPSDTTVTGGGVHITAGAPVSAYGLNTEQYTTDGFMGLPTSILGTSYRVEGYEGGGGSQFAVVGTQDGTTVTITPSTSTGAYTAGVPYTVTLNQGDVYQLIDSNGSDLSGSSITSSAPVAVMAGNSCADVPIGYAACNTLAEEMTPINTWGTDFLTEPLATRSGDTFRVMASEDGTTVDLNGSAVATLNAGKFYETVLTSASSVTSNNPIQVMQYSNGESYDGAVADPMDITIPPTEQFLNSYTVATEPSGADPAITQNYLNLVAPTAEVSSISLDGALLPASDFTPIAGSSYSGAQVAVGFGSHTVNASLPFGLTVYGFGGYDAYGYPGGFTLSPIATVSKVTLAPTTSAYNTGSSACETATVTDQNSDPVPGVRVDFTVTGVNPNAGFAYSAANGTAQYCYTGTAGGVDTESAAVGAITSNTASINWTLVAGKQPKLDTLKTGYHAYSAGSVSTNDVSTTGSGELLVALVQADGSSTATQTVTSVKGAGLTWTRTSWADLSGAGSSEVWQAYAPTKVTGATVQASFAQPADGSITVMSFTGAAHQLGAVGIGSKVGGPAKATITPTSSNSLVIAGGLDWSTAAKPVPVAGQSLVTWFLDPTVRDTYWTQSVAAPTTAGTLVTVQAGLPANDRWSLVAVEVPPAS